ncbi:unnamed protein product [Xylocopa violacea]|uniref:Calponin-homology (CH) domain-containing protein n=1 Tax=Xylocopa violacea TaxID=135666 RepID=A0ABP1NGT9_XYLVO
MVNEDEEDPKDQLEKLYAWITRIPLSKPTKNLIRDFSDAVMMAEILKVYYPRYVDLHNYIPASNLHMKKENWNILNRKVLSKIDMKLTKDTIDQLANFHPGTAENILLKLRKRILKDFEPRNSQDRSYNHENNDSIEEAHNKMNMFNMKSTSENALKTISCTKSMFEYAKKKLYFIWKWLVNLLCFWSYFPNTMFRLQNPLQRTLSLKVKETAGVSKTGETSETFNEEDAVPRHVCAQLKQELREIDDIISTLNHKVAYLESAMKLKDLQISNLTSQILQNAAESEQPGKIQMNNTQSKLRSQIVREKIAVEE